jgi:rhamnulokinase
VPETPGEFARTILESLGLRYRQVLESLESLLGRRFEVIHIVGGGSRNSVLNQFVADSTGRTVVAGPSEATALGNVLIQAIGAGAVSGLAEGREILRRSFALQVIEPKPTADWDSAYHRYCAVAHA